MIVLTGGAGFIGSALLWKLNEQGIDDILIVDHVSSTVKWQNLVKRSYRDYMHKAAFLAWLTQSDLTQSPIHAICHLGACSDTTQVDMDYLFENNVHYTQALFRFCAHHNIPFIYASSAATYGQGEISYSDDPSLIPHLRPLNPYGYSKQRVDTWILRQTSTPKAWVGFKFFNVYGPQEGHKGAMMSLVAKAVPQIQGSGTLKLFKSYKDSIPHGEQKRDFIYVKDVVDVLYHTLHQCTEGSLTPRGIYNLGSGQARSFVDLGHAVFKALHVNPKFEWVDMPLSLQHQYQYFTQADQTRMVKDLGYTKPFFSLEAGVEDYVGTYLTRTDPYL